MTVDEVLISDLNKRERRTESAGTSNFDEQMDLAHVSRESRGHVLRMYPV